MPICHSDACIEDTANITIAITMNRLMAITLNLADLQKQGQLRPCSYAWNVRFRSYRPAEGSSEFILLLLYITGSELNLALRACKGEHNAFVPVIHLLYGISLKLCNKA